MLNLTDKQIAEYMFRSYAAVDGLWFVKLEEKAGFDTALDIDEAVWKIMPKIQARKLRSMANIPDGLDGLFEAYTTKITLEGFEFETRRELNAFEIIVSKCPWYEIMVKSNRGHVAEKIGDRICNAEYGGWATEFGSDLGFELRSRICRGQAQCRLRFFRKT